MKNPKLSNKTRHGVTVLSLILSFILLISFVSGSTTVRAQVRPAAVHFTPVYRSENGLAMQINAHRLQSGRQSLAFDWDLFRFARMYAKDLAKGKVIHLDAKKTETLLRGLGRSPRDTGCLVIRGTESSPFPSNWWETKNGKLIENNKQPTAVGTGHASIGGKHVWVILYSTFRDVRAR